MLSLYVFYLQARHTSTEAQVIATWDRDDCMAVDQWRELEDRQTSG